MPDTTNRIPRIRVVIVAAYAAVRAGLHAILADSPDCLPVNEVSGSAELERILPDARADVALFDDNDGDAPHILDLLRNGGTALVTLTDDQSALPRLAASGLSAWGCVSKDAGAEQIVGAVRAAAAGLVALDPLLAAASLAVGGPSRHVETLPGEALTAREREVMQLMAAGLANKNIAHRLGISQHTVKFHVASILAKLGAASRTEAVTLGARRGDIIL